jgi:flagellin-like protein
MERRGISNILAVILLVLMIVVCVSVIYSFVKKDIKNENKKGDETLSCLQNVDLKLVSSCYTGNQLKFVIMNNNNFDYDTEFFILRVSKEGRTFDVPTNWHSILRGLEQREFIADISKPEEIEEAVFIPKIKEERGYCYGQAIKFKPKQCS